MPLLGGKLYPESVRFEGDGFVLEVTLEKIVEGRACGRVTVSEFSEGEETVSFPPDEGGNFDLDEIETVVSDALGKALKDRFNQTVNWEALRTAVATALKPYQQPPKYE